MNTYQDAFFFEGGRDFFFFDEPPPPFRRRWTKRARTATKAMATKDAPMARWCFTIPVSSGMRGTSPAQVEGAEISVVHGVGGMFAASGTIVMTNVA